MDEQLKNEAGSLVEGSAEEQHETVTTKKENHVSDKRSRLISASITATIIISVISVSVFGIFQLTTKWRKVCPAEIPVNDPAPVLWQDIISEQIKSAKLGVPEKVTDIYLKGSSLAENNSK